MLPSAVAVFARPRVIISAGLAAIACKLLPSAATSLGLALLAAIAVLAFAVVIAHVATRPMQVRDGDWLELGDRGRGRVRAVRFWYTVVDTLDGDTILIPNRRIQRGQDERPFSSE